MWQIFVRAAGSYAPYILAPAAFTVGFIGYNVEWIIRSHEVEKDKTSVIEDRYDNDLKKSKTELTEINLNEELYRIRPVLNLNKSANL